MKDNKNRIPAKVHQINGMMVRKDMKVRDLKGYIWDKVVFYKVEADDYADIYKGYINDTPENILDMEIGSIWAKRGGVIDIRVE